MKKAPASKLASSSPIDEPEMAGKTAQARAERWLRENAQALEFSNEYVDRKGLPLSILRGF